MFENDFNNFIKNENKLYYKYESSYGIGWILDKIRKKEEIIIHKIFFINNHNKVFIDEENDAVIIEIGELDEDYYKISSEILGINYELYFYKDIKFDISFFKAQGFRKNLFSMIEDVIGNRKQLYIGGEKADITIEKFKEILKNFPKKYEQDLYVDSRIYQVLENELDELINYSEKLELYRNKNNYTIKQENIFDEINAYEIEKFKKILNHLKMMLKKQESYNEKQWQEEIIKIICLIFPKYIATFREVKIKVNSTTSNKKNELIDILLINNYGNIDIIEIKKPHKNKIISKNLNRDNYYPSIVLTQTIMQIEKYIYHLNRWGQEAEKNLNDVYRSRLPEGISIKNINPKGIVIMGDANGYSEKEQNDLEVIKKMYANVIDIITYDDLINRLENIIESIEKNNNI